MCLVGRKQLSHGIQTRKNNEKPTINVKKSRQRSVYTHVLVRNNTWAGPWAHVIAGPAHIEPVLHGPRCHVMGRAGPRRLKK